MKSPRTLRDLFSMHGFVANTKLGGIFGDRYPVCQPDAIYSLSEIT